MTSHYSATIPPIMPFPSLGGARRPSFKSDAAFPEHLVLAIRFFFGRIRIHVLHISPLHTGFLMLPGDPRSFPESSVLPLIFFVHSPRILWRHSPYIPLRGPFTWIQSVFTAPALPVDDAADNAELEALIASLSDLDVATLSGLISCPPCSDWARDAASVANSPPVTPQRHNPQLYEFHSPQNPDSPWNGRRLPTTRKAHQAAESRPYSSRQSPIPKGVPTSSSTAVNPVSIHNGRAPLSGTQAAYEYAQAHHWTGVRGLSPPSARSQPSGISALPIPVDPLAPTTNPLHGNTDHFAQNRWYIVYAGITPGIYLSFLESSLNTIGLSRAASDSTTSLEEARRRWAFMLLMLPISKDNKSFKAGYFDTLAATSRRRLKRDIGIEFLLGH
ncbi:hypothetical protein B0H13DRAFT_2379567 [Mycena leptocephala]|nr:hypothetical protein B0H13DRAFT_2379567 [Mycena leptocephala]